jgi:hypothetical protein
LKPGLYVGAATTPTDVSAETGDGLIAKSLAWLKTNAANSTMYEIRMNKNENLAPKTLSSSNLNSKTGVTVTLTTVNTTPRTVQLSGTGTLFTVGENVILSLKSHVIIKGITNNNIYLVSVNGGTLELKDDAKITGNTSLAAHGTAGSGVAIRNGGTFNMSGGEISGNHILNDGGGGVRIYGTDSKASTFTMSDGIIKGNTSTHGGGGVFMNNRDSGSNSRFDMSGGEISDNTATYGGGVQISNNGCSATCIFNMSGNAIITRNKSTGSSESVGGGVFVGDSTKGDTGTTNTGSNENNFNMSGNAEISDNTATIGGGVFMHSGGRSNDINKFNMYENAIISGNTATYGGGVGIARSDFTKKSGTISGNIATNHNPISTNTVLVIAKDDADFVAFRDLDAGPSVLIEVEWFVNPTFEDYLILDGLVLAP